MTDTCDTLLARLAARPDDTDVRRVYADALSERGDPRGELIALELVLAASPARAPELAARVAAVQQPIDATLAVRLATTPRPHLRWRHGFVDAVELDYDCAEPPAVLARLANEPALRLVRRLAISASTIDGHGDLSPALGELARLAPAFPCLVELEVTEGPDFGNPWIEGPADIHDATLVLRAYPRLERLVLEGDLARFGAVDLPALRTLHVSSLDRDGAPTLAGVRAPALDDLAIGFRSHPTEMLLGAVDAVLAARFTPTTLSLSAQPDAMAEIIARASDAPISARVRRLGFARVELDDDAITALIARRLDWPQLVELRLAKRACSARMRARLARALGVPVVDPG